MDATATAIGVNDATTPASCAAEIIGNRSSAFADARSVAALVNVTFAFFCAFANSAIAAMSENAYKPHICA